MQLKSTFEAFLSQIQNINVYCPYLTFISRLLKVNKSCCVGWHFCLSLRLKTSPSSQNKQKFYREILFDKSPNLECLFLSEISSVTRISVLYNVIYSDFNQKLAIIGHSITGATANPLDAVNHMLKKDTKNSEMKNLWSQFGYLGKF